jgi:hypothetical protein
MNCHFCNCEVTEVFTQDSLYAYNPGQKDTFCSKKCADKFLKARREMMAYEIRNAQTYAASGIVRRCEETLGRIKQIVKNRNQEQIEEYA